MQHPQRDVLTEASTVNLSSSAPESASASVTPSENISAPEQQPRKPQKGDLSPDLPATEIAKLFLAHRQTGKSLKKRKSTDNRRQKTEQQMENEKSTAKLFAIYFGNREISSIDEDDCVEFFNVVQRLPSFYGKSSKHSKMDPREVAKT